MSDDYQIRKDIDDLYRTVWNSETNQLNLVQKNEFEKVLNKFGINQDNNDKFNYAVITRDNGNIEFWILANCYYDYSIKRFVKIDVDYTSHAIQIQAKGTYAGEEEIDSNNTSIGVWRNPRITDVYMDTEHYDYTDFIEKSYIGARIIGGDWVEFGISSGWNNTLMLDAYGGMTVGGAGFEIDGNGIFPFTRLTHSIATISGTKHSLFGLLDNAYHGTTGCDSNSTYSWFVGLMTPVDEYNHKDNTNTSFVVMYNNTPASDDEHSLDNDNWYVVFDVTTNGTVHPEDPQE